MPSEMGQLHGPWCVQSLKQSTHGDVKPLSESHCFVDDMVMFWHSWRSLHGINAHWYITKFGSIVHRYVLVVGVLHHNLIEEECAITSQSFNASGCNSTYICEVVSCNHYELVSIHCCMQGSKYIQSLFLANGSITRIGFMIFGIFGYLLLVGLPPLGE